MLTENLFNTFYQFVMSFAKDELRLELTIEDCSLRPKKLFHVGSLNSLDNILLHFDFTRCLSSPFADVISFITQSCLLSLLNVNSYNFWALALSENLKTYRLLSLHSL